MAIEGMPKPVEGATAKQRGGSRAATLLAAVAVVAMVIAFGQVAPLDYDETVYFGIAREIGRTGCPIRPEGAGSLFLNNPPLVGHATALAGLLGFDWAWLRLVHSMLWVGLLCMGIGAWARDEGRWAAPLAIASLLSQPLFMREAALVKLDVPLAAITALHCAYARDSMQGIDRRRALAITAALAVLVRYQGVLLVCTTVPVLWVARRRPEVAWSIAGAAFGAILWIALASGCGGDLLEAFGRNAARLEAAGTEPWFRRPLLTYGRDLAMAIGPTTLAAAVLAVVLRGRASIRRPAMVLALACVLVNLVFCSVIALKAERYFMPGFAALAVLAAGLPGALEIRGNLRAARWSAIGLVLATALAAATPWLAPRHAGINEHYRRVAARVVEELAADEVVLLPYAQVAWLADRRYRISLFEPDAARLLGWLRDPDERLELFVRDARIAVFHPMLAPTELAAIDDYLAQHFERVPCDIEGVTMLRRVSW